MSVAISRPSPPSPKHDVERPAKRLKMDTPTEAEMVEEQMSLPIQYVRTYSKELNYRNKLVLAPMVRTGSLPMRLLSLFYGAGLVWSPEVVDRAIIGAERTVDPSTGVITYSKGQGPIFTTHPMEKPFLIFQIGSSDPELALKAAETVQQDVSGIDLNCGCPKPFSTHSGMGAALLSTPDILLSILHKLLENIPLPISCKIRLLPEQPSTLYLVSRILRTGIRNLTVHCRTRNMRPAERALWERLSDVVDLGKRRGIPVICNGDGDGWSNWEEIRSLTGADSVMLARAAERNPSVFSPTGAQSNITDVIPKLLNLCEYIDNPWGNTKFLLNQFKPSSTSISTVSKAQKREVQDIISRSKSLAEVGQKLEVTLGGGKALLEKIESVVKSRKPDSFERRHEAVVEGSATDEYGA